MNPQKESIVDMLMAGPDSNANGNLNEQPSAPHAPPDFKPVEPNKIPPSYNPEYTAPESDTTKTNISHNTPQIVSNENMNAGQYDPNQLEGQITYNLHDLPPPDYKHKSISMNEPLIASTHTTNAPYTSASNYWKSKDCCSCDTDKWRSDKCKKLLMIAGALWIVAAILLIFGSLRLNDSLEFKRNSEQTTCSITSYTRSSCSYDCHCHKDKDGHKHCDTCYGDSYEYYATSGLCNGRTLKQFTWDDNGGCPETQKSIGYTSTCWVECNEEEFSFSSPNSLIAWSIVMLVGGSCCCCGGTGFSCKKACFDAY